MQPVPALSDEPKEQLLIERHQWTFGQRHG
jgi:hypothetical protein